MKTSAFETLITEQESACGDVTMDGSLNRDVALFLLDSMIGYLQCEHCNHALHQNAQRSAVTRGL